MSHLPSSIEYALRHHGPLDIHVERTDGRIRVVITGSHKIVDLTSALGLHPADALLNALAEITL